MTEHSVSCYPYASFTNVPLPLLKAAALYLDKLYILDPVGANWATVGADQHARETVMHTQLIQQESGLFTLV